MSATYFTPAAVAVIVIVSPVLSVKTLPVSSAVTVSPLYVTVYTSSVCSSPSYSHDFVEDVIVSSAVLAVISSVPLTYSIS